MAKRLYLGDLEIQTGGPGEAAPETSRFTGKTLLVSGDSITEKNFRSALNWHDFLKDWLGLGAVINDGKSGTGLTRTYGSSPCILDRMDSWPAQADIVLVMASMNDGGGNNEALPLGTLSDTGRGVSYFADCKAAVEKLAGQYPGKPFGFVTAPPRGTVMARGPGFGPGGWYHDWALALAEVCARYSVPCFDLYHNSGLRPWVGADNAMYFSCPASPQGDGTHPNAGGHMIIANRIIAFTKQYL